MAYNNGNFYHLDNIQVIEGVAIKNSILLDSTIEATKISGAAFQYVQVDCSVDYVLDSNEQKATCINIEESEADKTLTLGMRVGQVVVITNSTKNNVKVKNESLNTGVVSTAEKTAMFLITDDEPIKLTADV